MANKKIIMGVLLLSLVATTGLWADEPGGLNGSLSTLFPGINNGPSLTFMADETLSDYQDYTTGERFGIGFLNMLFGIGSFTHGHIGDGLMNGGLELAGVGCIVVGIVTGGTSITPVGWGLIAGGGTLYLFGAVFGWRDAFSYHKPQAKTARLDDVRNWQVALYPNREGNLAGWLAFTAHF
jgi:hypothetical protein